MKWDFIKPENFLFLTKPTTYVHTHNSHTHTSGASSPQRSGRERPGSRVQLNQNVSRQYRVFKWSGNTCVSSPTFHHPHPFSHCTIQFTCQSVKSERSHHRQCRGANTHTNTSHTSHRQTLLVYMLCACVDALESSYANADFIRCIID